MTLLATLKLFPRLPTSVAVSSFPSIEAAASTARDLVQQGVGLACIELLDDVMIKCINAKKEGRTWPETGATLFLKFEGSEAQIKDDIERTSEWSSFCSETNQILILRAFREHCKEEFWIELHFCKERSRSGTDLVFEKGRSMVCDRLCPR